MRTLPSVHLPGPPMPRLHWPRHAITHVWGLNTSVLMVISAAMQGFIEGKYVPLGEGEDVTASMDIVEADNAEEALAQKGSNGSLGAARAKVE